MENTAKIVKDKPKKKFSFLVVFVCVVLTLYVLSLLVVLGWGFLTSLKSTAEFAYRYEYIVNEAGELERVFDGNGDTIWNNNVLGLPDIIFSKYNFDYIKDYTMFGTYSIFNNYELVIASLAYDIPAKSYVSSIWGRVESEGFRATILTYVGNSLMYAGFTSVCFSTVSMLAGYLCSKYKFKFSSFLYTFLLTMMAIPMIGTSVSMVNLLQNLGIYNTVFSMIIMNCTFGGIYFFVYYAFFQGMPSAYIEAAEIDGASQTNIMFKIAFPLASKIFGTVLLIQFLNAWNNYEGIMLYYPNHPTLAYSMYLLERMTQTGVGAGQVQTDYLIGTPQKIAGFMLLAIPALTLFIIFNKTIMGNITVGGVKE